MRRRAHLVALVLFCLGGDCTPREQRCEHDTECLAPFGGYGLCIRDHCAFVDRTCPSEYRWDDAAGDQRDLCVPVNQVPDAGGLDAMP